MTLHIVHSSFFLYHSSQVPRHKTKSEEEYCNKRESIESGRRRNSNRGPEGVHQPLPCVSESILLHAFVSAKMADWAT